MVENEVRQKAISELDRLFTIDYKELRKKSKDSLLDQFRYEGYEDELLTEVYLQIRQAIDSHPNKYLLIINKDGIKYIKGCISKNGWVETFGFIRNIIRDKRLVSISDNMDDVETQNDSNSVRLDELISEDDTEKYEFIVDKMSIVSHKFPDSYNMFVDFYINGYKADSLSKKYKMSQERIRRSLRKMINSIKE